MTLPRPRTRAAGTVKRKPCKTGVTSETGWVYLVDLVYSVCLLAGPATLTDKSDKQNWHDVANLLPMRGGLDGLPLRVQREPSNFIYLFFRGVAEAVLQCAHRASTTSLCPLCEHEGWSGGSLPISLSSLVISRGWGLTDLTLRALSQSPISFSRVASLILDCARRTTTFLSCAFREQEDGQAALPVLLRPRIARARTINQSTSHSHLQDGFGATNTSTLRR